MLIAYYVKKFKFLTPVRSVSTLEVLHNRALQIDIYLLYLLRPPKGEGMCEKDYRAHRRPVGESVWRMVQYLP